MKLRVSKIYQLINDTAVFVYKLLGVPVLVILMLWTVSYLSLTVFYLASDRWLIPFIAGPSHERTIRESQTYNAHLQTVEKLKAELLLAQTKKDKYLQSLQADEKQFSIALNSFVREEQNAISDQTLLSDLQNLGKSYVQARNEILERYKRRLINAEQLQKELAAIYKEKGRKGQNELVNNGKHINRSIAAYNESKDRASLITSLSHIPLGFSAARVVRDMMELDARVTSTQQDLVTLESQIAQVSRQINTNETVIQKMRTSPFVQAADKSISMAFIPYQNSHHMKTNTKVYKCLFYFALCEQVGSINLIMESEEVSLPHPFFGTGMRGHLVQLEVQNASAMERNVLILNRPPLGF